MNQNKQTNLVYDQTKIRAIRERESIAPLVPCDNCGQDKKCKAYHLNEGNAILCASCFNKERIFQTSDEKGYTITDGSKDYYKRNFQSWWLTDWYGIES
jgi:hypothetical protein